MKKVLPLVLTLLIFLTGCAKQQAQTEATKQSDIVKTKKMEKRAQQKKAYQATLQSAQKEGTEQKTFLESVAKTPRDRSGQYGASGAAGIQAFAAPKKVSEFETNKFGEGSQAVVVTGVVTKWTAAPRYEVTGTVTTRLTLKVDRQLTFKKTTNLEGKEISLRFSGGYTTRGEEWDRVPYKSFAPKQPLTEVQRQQIVFVDSTEMPLPRIGSQVLVAMEPLDTKKRLHFSKTGVFSSKDEFSLASGENGFFYFDTNTGEYDAKVLATDKDELIHDPSLDGNVQDENKLAEKEMLNDINTHYLKE